MPAWPASLTQKGDDMADARVDIARHIKRFLFGEDEEPKKRKRKRRKKKRSVRDIKRVLRGDTATQRRIMDEALDI